MPPDNEPQSPVTEETVRNLINTTVNGVVASLKKQIAADRQKDSETLKGDLAKLLDEKLQTVKPADDDGGGKDGKGGKGGGGKSKENELEVANLRKELEAVRKNAEADRQLAATERAKNRAATLKSSVTEALTSVGITDRARHALALLQQEGRLGYGAEQGVSDDDDQIVFKSDDGSWVSLDVGLKGWAKSDDGKSFLPASGARGSGGRPGNNPPSGGPVTPEQASRNLWGELAKNL